MSRHLPRAYRRQRNEAYYTPPHATLTLCRFLAEHDLVPRGAEVWECAAGAGHVARAIADFALTELPVFASDVAPARGAVHSVAELDFLRSTGPGGHHPLAIITNPPYGEQNRTAIRFIGHALDLAARRHGLVAMLLPFGFDAASSRDRLAGGHEAFATKLTCGRRIRWLNVPQKKHGPIDHHSWFIWIFEPRLLRRARAAGQMRSFP